MIKLKSLIKESMDQWKGRWVHYSNKPFLKINPKPSHCDLMGIYLFPEKFKPIEHWLEQEFKFVIEVPDNLNILDIAKTSKETLLEILNKLGLQSEKGYDYYINNILNPDTKNNRSHAAADNWWEFLQNVYMMKKAKWNADFRKLGYDGIFDDTGSIHSREVQLIILDPTKIKVIDIVRRKGTGYKEVLLVMNRILTFLKKYKGHVKVGKPKKGTSSSYRNEIQGFIQFSTLPDSQWEDDKFRQIYFKIYPKKFDNQKGPPYLTYVYVSSTPSRSYGVGAEYNVFQDDWTDVDKLEKEVEWVVNSPTKYTNR